MTASPAPAITVSPGTPRPASSAPPGFTARAHANFTAGMQHAVSGTAQFVLLQRGNALRVEILSVHSDAMPLPPISGTILIDRSTGTATIWSDATRRYYVQRLTPNLFGRATPRPQHTATPAPHARSSPLRDFDVLSLSMKLTGHTVTSGIPTTGLAFDVEAAHHGMTAPTHLTATVQLADDYALFPVSLDATLVAASGARAGRLTYAIDSWQPTMPPLTMFRVPPGYMRASSPFAVFTGPVRRPSPAPVRH